MKKRRFFAAVLTAVMALGLLAGTASAGGGAGATVWVAHGIPGVKVDVCVNGDEVRSNFKYGNTFALEGVPAGTYRIKVRLASAGDCKGAVAIDEKVDLTDGLNATAVARVVKGQPALSIFVNDIGIADADNASVTVRHTAKAPTVAVWVNGGAGPLVPGLKRGAEAGPVEVPGDAVYSYWVSAEGDSAPVIGPDVAELAPGVAYQILAVGSNASNWRFIVTGQAGDLT
jgi:Domain of unknown function (DUF4397)